jgi:hypothetical protein
MIDRLWPVVIDLEQTLGPAVVVSHVSVLQVLLSYFRASPVSESIKVEVPMHTVFKFVPLRGGGWLESQHVLLSDDDAFEPMTTRPSSTTLTTICSTAQLYPSNAAPSTDSDDSPDSDTTSKETDIIWGDSRSCMPHRLE